MVKSLRPVKIRLMVKSLRPVEIRRMVKSLPPVKIRWMVKSLRPVKCRRPWKRRRSCLLFRLGRICNCWHLPGPADEHVLLLEGVESWTCSLQVRTELPACCFYVRTLSRTVPAACTGLPWSKMVQIHAAAENQASAWLSSIFRDKNLCSYTFNQKTIKKKVGQAGLLFKMRPPRTSWAWPLWRFIAEGRSTSKWHAWPVGRGGRAVWG